MKVVLLLLVLLPSFASQDSLSLQLVSSLELTSPLRARLPGDSASAGRRRRRKLQGVRWQRALVVHQVAAL